MIGGVDHQRVLGEAVSLQAIQDFFDHPVHCGREAVIGGSRADLPIVGKIETIGETPPVAKIGMLGIVPRRRQPGQADLAVVVRKILGRADIGLVRQHQADGDGERRVVTALSRIPDLVEMIEGGFEHVPVLHLVGGLARTRALQADPERFLGAVEHPHPMGVAADPVGAVIADPPVDIAVQLVGADRVETADQRRPVAAGAESMGVGRDVGGGGCRNWSSSRCYGCIAPSAWPCAPAYIGVRSCRRCRR